MGASFLNIILAIILFAIVIGWLENCSNQNNKDIEKKDNEIAKEKFI